MGMDLLRMSQVFPAPAGVNLIYDTVLDTVLGIPRASGGEPLSAALFFLAAKVIPCASGGEPSVFEGYKTIIEFSLRQRGGCV